MNVEFDVDVQIEVQDYRLNWITFVRLDDTMLQCTISKCNGDPNLDN